MKTRQPLLTSIVVLLFSTVVFAQQGQGGKGQQGGAQRMSLDDRVARMTEELDLSDEQASQVREVMKNARATRPNVRMLDSEEAKPVICKHMVATDSAISDILNDEQAAEYDVLKASRKAAMAGGGGGGRLDCSEFQDA